MRLTVREAESALVTAYLLLELIVKLGKIANLFQWVEHRISYWIIAREKMKVNKQLSESENEF